MTTDNIIWNGTVKKITKADELHSMAESIRNMSRAEHMYAQFVEQAEAAARQGAMEVAMQFYKKTYFSNLYEVMKARGFDVPISEDEYVAENYNAQTDLLKIFEENGFTVDIAPKSSLILLNQDPNDRSAEFVESDVTIRW